MEFKGLRTGFALTGSFCTFAEIMGEVERLSKMGCDIIPIMSGNAYNSDTRFGRAEEFINRLEEISGKSVIHTIPQAEPIGPKAILDVLIIAPCTGNTLAKMANGISDTAVTLAAKSHLRNGRPLIIGVSTNDALGGNAGNIGELLNRKNIYFVPFRQDNPHGKPTSLIAKFEMLPETLAAALEGRQIQPVICG